MDTQLTQTVLGGAVTAVLIGLLLGFEREHSRQSDEGLFAGIRTFPILALCGFVAARLGSHALPLALPVTMLGVSALAVAAYLRSVGRHSGATTEVAALLATLLGALVAWGEGRLAASIAVLVTLLLTMKSALHRLASGVTEEEINAILRFAIVAVILVPLLPAEPMGPYEALVPRRVGIVVVVLSAVSLAGYLLVRLLGGRAGWSLAGMVGGLVSSTAVTLSFAGKARTMQDAVRPLAVGIVLASTVLYARALALAAFFDPPLGLRVAPAFGALFVAGLTFAGLSYFRMPAVRSDRLSLGNPTELGRAIVLGLIFAGIVLGARIAQARAGERGLWATGLVGGFVDVDSVVVALADLRARNLVATDPAAKTLLLASVSNLALKGGVVAVVGGAALARRVLPAFVGLALLTFGLLNI